MCKRAGINIDGGGKPQQPLYSSCTDKLFDFYLWNDYARLLQYGAYPAECNSKPNDPTTRRHVLFGGDLFFKHYVETAACARVCLRAYIHDNMGYWNSVWFFTIIELKLSSLVYRRHVIIIIIINLVRIYGRW